MVCRGWPVQPICNPEYVYLGVMGIDIIPCINILCLIIRATRGRPYRVANDFVVYNPEHINSFLYICIRKSPLLKTKKGHKFS